MEAGVDGSADAVNRGGEQIVDGSDLVDVRISIQDMSGCDLLDEDYSNNIFCFEIKMEYEGEEYILDLDASSESSVDSKALRLEDGELLFGGFASDQEFTESMTLTIENGGSFSIDVVSTSLVVDDEEAFDVAYYLNGEQIEGNNILVKTTIDVGELDVTEVNVPIYLYDAYGRNILDPDSGVNFDPTYAEIKVLYNGEEYLLGDDNVTTRQYLATFSGLRLDSANNRLVFGDFQGDEDHDITITLDMDYGFEYEIRFVHNYSWVAYEPVLESTYYINGEQMDAKCVNCVIDPTMMDCDYFPMDFYITVLNSAGDNLLDSNVDGNILSNDIKATYQDAEYSLGAEVAGSSVPFAQFNGFTLGSNCLKFGEFNSDESHDVELAIDLGEGKTYEVRMVYSFDWMVYFPVIETLYYLNGEAVEKGVTIVVE